MVRCSYTQSLNLPADRVWARFSRFGEISWLPGIERVEVSGDGVGMIRSLYIPGLDDPIEETLESLDDAHRQFSYRVKKNPFVPYNEYHATVTVEAAGPGAPSVTKVTIESTFTLDPMAADAAASDDDRDRTAREALSGSYKMMVDALVIALRAE
jgi:hypothetical protein